MKIIPIDDGNSDFSKVELKSPWPFAQETPHCADHRAMNKVSVYEDGKSGLWRCLPSFNCRAGCQEINETNK